MSDNTSENSFSKGEGNDLNAKYSRLATEYSKIRAQNSVLKKAVIDEQTKNIQLDDVLREKEQIIRKFIQEIESLNFRNSQLSRRVAVLQEETDVFNKNGKKKSKNPSDISNGVVENALLDEEIRKIMIENAKLISELNDKDEKHHEEVSALKKEINSLNYEVDQNNIKIKQLNVDYELAVEQFQQEQQDFKRDYANVVNKLRETEVELSTLKQAHKSYVNEIGPKLESVTVLCNKRVPFPDEENGVLNKLNVRRTKSSLDEISQNELLQKYFTTLILTVYNIVHNVTLELKQLGFEELKLYFKALLKKDDEILWNEKLNACYRFLENIGSDCSIPESMEYTVYQFMKSFLDLCFSIYSSYIHHSCKKLYDSFDHSNNSVNHSMSAFQTKKINLIEKIMILPNSQHALICDEFENLNVATSNLMGEIDNIDHKYQQLINQKSADTMGFKKKARSYLRSLKKEKSEHISYEEALENKKKMQEYIMLNNTLRDELKTLENVLISLEQEKTYFMNEYEILQIKLNSKINETIQKSNDVLETTNEMGKYTLFENISPEILAREKNIQTYMNRKLNEIMIIKQEACSKARTYMLECKALQRRLENCIVEKHLLENEYTKFKKISLESREELSTISQNYESQLSMMSEHVASLNEKLTLQSEEIDNLKYQLSNKVRSKFYL
ncbi:hypothetical protein PGB90_009988 [Kerria lacca]